MGMRGSWSSMSISTSSPGLSKLTSSVGGAVSRPERGLPQGLSPPEPQDSALGLATLFTPCLPLPPTHPSLSRLPSLSPSPQFSLWLPPHPTDPCISLSLGLFCTTPHLSIDPPNFSWWAQPRARRCPEGDPSPPVLPVLSFRAR